MVMGGREEGRLVGQNKKCQYRESAKCYQIYTTHYTGLYFENSSREEA